MTTLWLRVGLIVALIASLFVGIWDFFQAPSKETAVDALIPTVEKVERAQAITDPVVDFVSRQDAESVEAMLDQARVEFDQSLSHPGAPVKVISEVRKVAAVVSDRAATGSASAPPATWAPDASGSTALEPGREPGMEWYRED